MTAQAAQAAWASSVSNPVKRAPSPADPSRGNPSNSGGNGDYALEDLCLRSGRRDRRGDRHGDHVSISPRPRDAHGRRRDGGRDGSEHGSVPDRARRRRSAEEQPASASGSFDDAAGFGFDSGHHVLFRRFFFSNAGSVQSIRVRSRAQRCQLVLEPVRHALRGAVQGFGHRREPDPSSGDRVAACGKEVERALVAGVRRLQQRNLVADTGPGRDEVGVREAQLACDLPNLRLLDSGHLVVGS